MTPVDLLPLAILVLYAVTMGRALLWQLTKLCEQDAVTGSAAWVASIILAWVLVVLVSLQAGLLWVAV